MVTIAKKRNIIFMFLMLIAVKAMAIGYATVSGVTLFIEGSAQANTDASVFISSVEYTSNNGAILSNCEIIDYTGTLLNSNIVLGNNASSTITYTITVWNTSDHDYTFTGTSYSAPDFYSNTNITFDLAGINVGYVLHSNSSKTFTITFRYTGSNTSNPSLSSYISFDFERTYSIVYNLNNGTNNASNPTTFVPSSPVSILDPTRANCYFGGWYLNDNFTGDVITSTSSFTGDTVLYAKWIIDINYTLNGGTQPSNQIYQFVENIDEAILPATRQYYIFDGWHNAQNALITSTIQLSLASRNLSATWSLMVEKSTFSNNIFTANNISGNVDYTSLAASNGTTYTYAGVNKIGTQINSVRVRLTHNKSQGKADNVTCDVYKSYADYQNGTNLYGTTTVGITKTSPANFNITLTNPIPEDGEFIVLFSNVLATRGTFSGISIQFNP